MGHCSELQLRGKEKQTLWNYCLIERLTIGNDFYIRELIRKSFDLSVRISGCGILFVGLLRMCVVW